MNRCRIDIASEITADKWETVHNKDKNAERPQYYNYSYEKTVNELNRVLDNEAFSFAYCEFMDYNIGINGGSGVTNSNGSFTLSVGGTYQSSDVVLTAGHCIDHYIYGYDDELYYNSYNISSNAIVQLADDEYGDYAICFLNPNYTSNNKIYVSGNSTINIDGTVFSGVPPTNFPVYGYGDVSGSLSFLMYDSGYNAYSFGYYLRGMARARNASGATVNGDSGGPVYTQYNGNQYLGVISGSMSGGGYYYVVYTPVGFIESRGFTVKTN